MDEELPIAIYIMTRCTSKFIFSSLEYISMYMKSMTDINNADLDTEEKIITTIHVRVRIFIAGIRKCYLFDFIFLLFLEEEEEY